MLKFWLNLTFCAAACSAFAQELVKDINTFPTSLVGGYSRDNICFSCGNYTYFYRYSTATGRDLWRTDGTTEGTIMVHDRAPTSADNPNLFTDQYKLSCQNGKVYFLSNKLWKSDGTLAGTTESFTSNLQVLDHCAFNDKIVFTVTGSVYVTTGQPGAETLLRNFGPEYSSETLSVYLIPAGAKFYSIVRQNVNSKFVYHLWVSDGTSFLFLRTFTTLNGLEKPTVFGDKLIFTSGDEGVNPKVWITDGTLAGTVVLKDIYAVPVGVVDGKVFLNAANEIWTTDGTTGGTVKVLDGYSTASAVIGFGGNLFISTNQNGRVALKVSLDYLTTTVVARSNTPWYMPMGVANGKIFFVDNQAATGEELYAMDAAGNKSLVKNIRPGAADSEPYGFFSNGNNLFFLANDGEHGFELWKSDGTDAGTVLIKDVANATETANLYRLYQYKDKLYFFATHGEDFVRNLWVSDGTTDGTKIHYECQDECMPLASVKNYIVLVDKPNTGMQVLKADLETGGTSILFEPSVTTYGLGGFYPSESAAAGNSSYFYGSGLSTGPGSLNNIELWKVTPSTNELSYTKDINPGMASSWASSGIKYDALGDKIVFAATSPDGEEPWVSDGTEAGTFQLANISPTGASSPRYFKTVGDKVFFVASTSATGSELWTTDGTTAGTKMVIDLRPGNGSGITSQTPLVALGNKVVFAGDNDITKSEPWISDGTVEGTKNLKDISEFGSSPGNFVTAGNKVFFSTGAGQLWITDGTEAGTKEIRLNPAFGTTITSRYAVVDDALYFVSNNNKIWRTFGTPGSTRVIGEAPKITSSLFVLGENLCFVADDVNTGSELYRIKLPGIESQTIVFTGFDNLEVGEQQSAFIESSSGFPVEVTSSDPSTAEYSGNKLTIHKVGTVTLTATQAGNKYFSPAAATKQITIKANDGVPNPTEPTNPVTAINEITSSIQVFPSPVKTSLNIKTDLERSVSLKVFDLNGREMLDRESSKNEISIDVSSFAAGMYVIVLTQGSHSYRTKFVKQ